MEKERLFDNKRACITFVFNARNHEELLFATQQQIFAWSYMDEEKQDRVIQRYLMPLDSANLRYVKFNEKQNCAVVVTDSDAAFIQFQTKKEKACQIDLDDQEGIKWIRTV